MGVRVIYALALAGVACNADRKPVFPQPPPATEAASSTPPGEPPFRPVSAAALPAHRHLTWHLTVLPSSDPSDGGAANLASESWEVAETRAGDVPMPTGWPWKCRYGPVWILPSESTGGEPRQGRELSCSTDNWRTMAGDAAEVWLPESPVAANVHTRFGENFVVVVLQPCLSGCGPATELP